MIHKMKIAVAVALFSVVNIYAGNPLKSGSGGGYFDVYLKNNCSKVVEVTVRADGSSSVSKYNTSEKQKVAVKEGYEVYVDGKLLQKFVAADSGKEISLCK